MHNDPLIGQRLGNFRIDRLLGRGGMGQVYAGYDLNLERPVALKVIDTRHRENASYGQRFLREARAIATCRHEHIVQIYAAGDQDGLHFFAMEYIEGEDLGVILRRAATRGELLAQAEVLRIGRALAGALDYAHAKGIIHRDVKPANVMIARDGRVVLMDFGLALDVDRGSIGEVFGSAHYIAPEQARRSSEAVPQSDLYALGVILYELLTGSVPFDDPSATSVAVQHLTLPPPPPRTRNPALSPAIETVLLTALSKAPAERYQTGAELIAALAAALPQAAPPTALLPSLLRTDSLTGQQLGDYVLEAPLGRGGMAHIYRGRDVRLQRQVAIKVIDTPFREDTVYTTRFTREAQAIAQLEHPHIVRLYQYGDADGLLYMAMEYVDGITLDGRIRQERASGRTMPPAEALALLRPICAALDYAHRQGVIHRDVKPANILIDQQGRPVLADFGLALLTDIGTRGEIFGTPHYMAPEQAISSANVTPQSDLYAVGVMLYELLTGQVPFDDPDPLAVAMQQMTEPPPPPRQIAPAITPALEGVILRALVKDPAGRYPTGAALMAALDQALAGQPSAAPPPLAAVAPGGGTPAEPPPATPLPAWDRPTLAPPAAASGALRPPRAAPGPWVRRHPLASGLVAAGLILLALLLVRSRNDDPAIAAALATRTAQLATTPTPGSQQAAVGGQPGGEPAETRDLPADLSGAVLIEDALTSAAWYTQQDASGSMAYVDGAYQLAIPAGVNTFWSLAPSSLAIPEDQVALSVTTTPQAGKAGIVFGFKGLSNHYRLVTQADGSFSLEKRSGRSIETLASGTGATAGPLTLVLRGAAVRVYAGSDLLGEAQLETAPGGRFGLILTTPDAGEALFRGFSVRAVP
jgi:serine/threonine protein kinase